MSESVKSELIDKLTIRLSDQFGQKYDEMRNILISEMNGYDVSTAETEIVPYNGGMNEYLIKRFIVGKTIQGLTERTIKHYYSSLRRILKSIGKTVGSDLKSEDIQLYFAMQMRNGIKKVSLNNEAHVLSTFYQWLCKEELVTANPMLKIDRIKFIRTEKEAFTDEEIERIRMSVSTWRERAIVEILLSTGCRVSELVSIKREEAEGTDTINILGKGEKYRNVYINAKARIAIDEYLKERNDINPYLFPKGIGFMQIAPDMRTNARKSDWYTKPSLVADGPMDKSSIEKIVRNIGEKAGVENCHPHRFRRTCATMALRRGMGVELVSKMLGHANVQTTTIYLDISEEDLKNAHKKFVTA